MKYERAKATANTIKTNGASQSENSESSQHSTTLHTTAHAVMLLCWKNCYCFAALTRWSIYIVHVHSSFSGCALCYAFEFVAVVHSCRCHMYWRWLLALSCSLVQLCCSGKTKRKLQMKATINTDTLLTARVMWGS